VGSEMCIRDSSNLVPVFGVISSILLLGENASPWHGVSFLLILAGVVLVNRQGNQSGLTKRAVELD